jgi:hypothetical protein
VWIVGAGRGEDDQKRGEGMMIRRRRGDDDGQKSIKKQIWAIG